MILTCADIVISEVRWHASKSKCSQSSNNMLISCSWPSAPNIFCAHKTSKPSCSSNSSPGPGPEKEMNRRSEASPSRLGFSCGYTNAAQNKTNKEWNKHVSKGSILNTHQKNSKELWLIATGLISTGVTVTHSLVHGRKATVSTLNCACRCFDLRIPIHKHVHRQAPRTTIPDLSKVSYDAPFHETRSIIWGQNGDIVNRIM